MRKRFCLLLECRRVWVCKEGLRRRNADNSLSYVMEFEYALERIYGNPRIRIIRYVTSGTLQCLHFYCDNRLFSFVVVLVSKSAHQKLCF